VSTTVEEVQAKLSMDVSTLGRAKREIAEFNAGGHAGFLHHTNGAREFHKSIHALTEQVPGLGIAFQALMSPIGATMTAATMAFTYAKTKLDEWNAEMDKTAERNAKAVFGKDALLAVGVTQAKMHDEYESFMRRRDDSEKRFRDGVKDEQDKIKESLEIEKKRLALRKEGAELIIRGQVERGVMSPESGMMASMALEKTSQHKERGLEQDAVLDRADALRKGEAEASAQREAAAGELADIEQKREKAVHDLAEREALLPDQEATLETARKASAKKQEEVKEPDDATVNTLMYSGGSWAPSSHRDTPAQIKVKSEKEKEEEDKQAKVVLKNLHEQEKAHENNKAAIAATKVEVDKLNNSYGESKQKFTKWDSEWESIKEQSRKLPGEQRKLQNSPLAAVRPGEFSSPDSFSTSELAGYNTRYGAIARTIQQREEQARYADAAGDSGGAEQIRKHGPDFTRPPRNMFDMEMEGKGIQDLYNLLPKGMTKEQQAGDRSKAMIDSILESLSGNSKAVSVKVISVANGQ
jgi:hypothetical protein